MHLSQVITKPVRSADPTFEPLTLEEAKKQIGVGDIDVHDAMLNDLIKEAREQVEHDTGLVCGTGTFTYKFTDWPCGDYFELPLRPVTSITSIVYVDSGGTSTTWTSTNYSLETSTVQPIVRLTHGNFFPSLRGDINGITVTLVAGYATRTAIPIRLKQACLLRLQMQWNLHLEMPTSDLMAGYDRMLASLQRSTYP